MTLPPGAPSASPRDPEGSQTPRISTVPATRLSSSGQEAVELAALAGLKLDPWQQHVLDLGLSEREDGRWSAFEVCGNAYCGCGGRRARKRSSWSPGRCFGSLPARAVVAAASPGTATCSMRR